MWYNKYGEIMEKIINFKDNINKEEMFEVAEAIDKGKIVVFPTETVYGIGANAFDKDAVNRIFIAKGRPTDNPLIVHICDEEMLSEVVEKISDVEKKIIDNFMPGPITIILPKKGSIPDNVTCGLKTVGIRMPQNNIARELIKTSGVPIAAPSANISGKPSGTNVEDILEELKDRVDYIVDGGACNIGVESTVIKVEKDVVNILRPGKISPEDFEKIGLKVHIDSHIFSDVKDGEKVESPGMKHRHYAPNAKAVLVCIKNKEKRISKIKEIIDEKKNSYNNIFIIGSNEDEEYFENVHYISYGSNSDLNLVSKNIFKSLRMLDNNNCDFCIIEGVEKTGVGIAIENRLLRACEYNVIKDE